jgi:alpha-N-acetylglucosamine transferase
MLSFKSAQSCGAIANMRRLTFLVIATAALLSLSLVTYRYYDYPLPVWPERHGSATTISDTPERRAYATFLSTRITDLSQEDTYFTAVRVLSYQLLHAPETRTNLSIPFVVMVPPHVSMKKREILAAEGAIILPVDNLAPDTVDWVKPGEDRFVDQFTKLRLFEQTQYSRILYLDADMLLMRSLDAIWDEPVAQQIRHTLAASDSSATPDIAAIENQIPSNYTIVGVSDTGGPDHPFPPPTTSMLNGGFFLLRPCEALFKYYTALLNAPNLFDSSLMEQSLLNYAHKPDGRMPWQSFQPGKWNVNWPRWSDVQGGAATLHDKFWAKSNEGWMDRQLLVRWWKTQGQMEGFWQKKEESKRK